MVEHIWFTSLATHDVRRPEVARRGCAAVAAAPLRALALVRRTRRPTEGGLLARLVSRTSNIGVPTRANRIGPQHIRQQRPMQGPGQPPQGDSEVYRVRALCCLFDVCPTGSGAWLQSRRPDAAGQRQHSGKTQVQHLAAGNSCLGCDRRHLLQGRESADEWGSKVGARARVSRRLPLIRRTRRLAEFSLSLLADSLEVERPADMGPRFLGRSRLIPSGSPALRTSDPSLHRHSESPRGHVEAGLPETRT